MIKIQATEVQQYPTRTYVTVRVESVSGFTLDRRTRISRTMVCQGVVTVSTADRTSTERWALCSRLRQHITPSVRHALETEVMQWLPVSI